MEFLPVIAYLLLVLLVPVWRLLRRPRFPGACLAAIEISFISLFLIFYEPYRISTGDFPNTLAALELFFWLIVLIPIQLVLLGFTFAQRKEKEDDRHDSDRFGLTEFHESFLGRSNAEKLKEP